jgi:hypothetical protein
MSLIRIAFLSSIFDYVVAELQDFFILRRVNSSWFETLIQYSDDIWKRLMNRRNFIKSARLNFQFIIDMLSKIGSESNLLPALMEAGSLKHTSFYYKLLPYVKTDKTMLLFVSARFGDLETCKILIENGISVNESFEACSGSFKHHLSKPVAYILWKSEKAIEHNVSPTEKMYKYFSPTGYEINGEVIESKELSYREDYEVYSIFSKQLNMVGNESLLQQAILSGNILLVKYLTDKGANVGYYYLPEKGDKCDMLSVASAVSIEMMELIYSEMTEEPLFNVDIYSPKGENEKHYLTFFV